MDAIDRTPVELRRLIRPGFRAFDVWLAAFGFAALGYAVILDALTLTRSPEPFGDEAWVGSAVWSVTHGHGLRPVIALGTGIYDGTLDYWMPRLGVAPQVVASLIGGTSLTVYRAASLAVTFVALALLWRSLARRYGAGPAAAA